MPSKVCNQAGCHALVPMSERYCEAHRREVIKHKNEVYDHNHRNREHDKFYHSKEWKIVREQVMKDHGGLCVQCDMFDIVNDANVVDHIIPIEVDYEKRLDITNLQPLCHQHHAGKTADDLRRNRRG